MREFYRLIIKDRIKGISNKLKAIGKTVFFTVKPFLRVLFPDISTICLLYACLMAFALRGRIDGYLASHFPAFFNQFFLLLNTKTIANWATAILLVLCGAILLVRENQKKSYTLTLLLCGAASYYLLTDKNWEWVSILSFVNYRVLLSVLFLAFFVSGIIRLVRHLKTIPQAALPSRDTTRGLINRTPRGLRQETGWKAYAHNLVSKLLITDLKEESFAVGVSGVWGSGKSSFLEEIKQELSGKAILLEFNPWNCESSAHITKDYFETIISGLSISSSQRRSIKRYSKLLGTIDAVKPFVEPIVFLLDQGDQSLIEAKRKAEEVIESYESPVVMFIDDLDRLDGKELLSVLKLIRTSANFKNLIFILAYDKNYLSKSLESVGGEKFLKKIVQLEVCLPDYESYILESLLYSELKGKGIEQTVVSSIESRLKYLKHSISTFLPTFRDINRFVNLFCLNLSSFEISKTISEICIQDLFFVELLHYFDDKAYQLLRTSPDSILSPSSKGVDLKTEYSFARPSFDTESQVADSPKKLSDGACDLLYLLFGVDADEVNGSIRYPINFSKYFSFRVNNDVISLGEFNRLLESEDLEVLKQLINEYCSGTVDRCRSLYAHLISVRLNSIIYSSRHGFETRKRMISNVLFSIFELGNYYEEFSIPGSISYLFRKVNICDKLPGESLTSAIRRMIQEESYRFMTIQQVLSSLVKHHVFDHSDGETYDYEFADVLFLSSISGEVFDAYSKGRYYSIDLINDSHSDLRYFLFESLALLGQEIVGPNEVIDCRVSLLINALVNYYSKKDNSKYLDKFFDNFNPYLGREDEYQDVLDYELIHSMIASTFGNVDSFRDFYTFLKAAFPNQIPQVNKRLEEYKMDPIPITGE